MEKVLAIILALAMVFSFAACGEKKEEQKQEEPKKVLKCATNVAFPPYEYYGSDGKATGIDVEILKAIAAKIGYDFELSDMEFGGIIAAVETGKVDVGFGAITITEDRKKSVNFTTSYATGIQSVIVPEGSAIKSVDDLYADNVIIGVQENTTGDIYCTDDFGDAHVLRFKAGADAVQAVLTGKASAVVVDNSPAKVFVSQNKGLTILPTAYAEEEYGFEISYKNEALYKLVNDTLESMLKDGSVQKIIDTFIKAE